MGTERRFNPLAKYASVTPPYKGAVHMQDGGYFSPDGKLLWEDHPPTPPKVVTSEVIITDANKPGQSEVEVVTKEVPDFQEGDPKEILKMWLKGEVALHHTKVRILTTKAYSVTLGTRDEIINFLVNEAHLVAAEQVNIKAPPSAAETAATETEAPAQT